MTLILGIESSCDETAASVVEDGCHVRSNIIATQHDLHARYAGVVPEIASRAHLERILPVIEEALTEAKVKTTDLVAIAVGHRPGLIGSLLVGVSTAKALAWSLNKPLIGVDHILAHLHAAALDHEAPKLPALGLVLSGGHSNIFRMDGPLEVTLLGRTIDDAIGEAYDKVATILHLGFPGGPKLDVLAADGNDRAHDFPVARLQKDRLDFSFSGLKTAVLYAVRGKPVGRGADAHFERDAEALTQAQKADFAASFQRAAVTAVLRRIRQAIETMPIRSIIIGGGVSANSRLRRDVTQLGADHGIDVHLPAMRYCLDNAAMIAGLAHHQFVNGQVDDLTLTAATNSTVGMAEG